MRKIDCNDLSDFARADFFDSRDVQARIDELESDVEDDAPDEQMPLAEMKDELVALNAFRDESEGYSGDKFRDGITFIADSYFEQYAREFAEEIGAIDDDAKWPATCIDWSAAAHELQHDYASIELDGNTFWYR